MVEKPKLADEVSSSAIDDVQGITSDIGQLYDRFIKPIEDCRSLGADSPDAREPVESRIHAFYRMVGFPVAAVSAQVGFYNPGYLYPPSGEILTKQSLIDSQISDDIRQMCNLRERTATSRYQIFKKPGPNRSVLSVAMGHSPKPFQTMNKDLTYGQFDAQTFMVSERTEYVTKTYKQAAPSSTGVYQDITNAFASNAHMLRPFAVLPDIEKKVQEGWRRFCQPFLPITSDKRSTLYDARGGSKDIHLKRPVIEQVLRFRLRQNRDQNLTEIIANILSSSPRTYGKLSSEEITRLNQLTAADLRLAAGAIFNNANITDEEITEALKSSTTYEISMANNYIKIISRVIDVLHKAVDGIALISQKISWTPYPNDGGPEKGCEMAYFIAPKQPSSVLENEINKLRIKAAIAKQSAAIFKDDTLSISDFAMPMQLSDASNLYEDKIKKKENYEKNLQNNGFKALKDIEIITGEISGLGLIDILAIYTALWTIDMKDLIGLLDEDAYQRLMIQATGPEADVKSIDKGKNTVYDTQLAVAESYRKASPGFRECMSNFEKQVINILDFADRQYIKFFQAKDESEGGSPAGG